MRCKQTAWKKKLMEDDLTDDGDVGKRELVGLLLAVRTKLLWSGLSAGLFVTGIRVLRLWMYGV